MPNILLLSAAAAAMQLRQQQQRLPVKAGWLQILYHCAGAVLLQPHGLEHLHRVGNDQGVKLSVAWGFVNWRILLE